MKKLLVIIGSALFFAQPLLSASFGSSGTSSSGSSSKDKKVNPFASVYYLIDLKKFAL